MAKRTNAPKKDEVAAAAKEEDLVLPSSSDESEESKEESEDEIVGLSSDEEEESTVTSNSNKKVSGHLVNKQVYTKSTPKTPSKKKRAIVFIGRLPHGFYEEELEKYFTQFGDIVNLRISRNKKTGKSKHYGFIEFSDHEVAKIASETMDNYLLFGHLLKCKLLEDSPVYESLFKQSSKFKVVPWNKISKHRHDKPKSREQWDRLVKKHEQKKLSKLSELKKKGIDFDLSSI